MEDFLKTEEVNHVSESKELFDYYFKEREQAESWTVHTEEPDKKISYKYVEGEPYVSIMYECTVEAPIINTLNLFAELDHFVDWMPNMLDAKTLHTISNFSMMVQCRQSMPWPMAVRENVVLCTGMIDEKNKACLIVMKSFDDDRKEWFGKEIPKVVNGDVRMTIKRGYHYFQMISEE